MTPDQARVRLTRWGEQLARWGTQALAGAHRAAMGQRLQGPPSVEARRDSLEYGVAAAQAIGERVIAGLPQTPFGDDVTEAQFWEVIRPMERTYVEAVLTAALALLKNPHRPPAAKENPNE